MLLGIVTAVFWLTLLLQTDPAGSQSRVKGHAVDSSGAAIPAVIRVIRPDNHALVVRLQAQDNGAFETSSLPPGVYSLTVFAPGFRRREFRHIAVRSGQLVDLGQIRLDLSGCDTPGTNCDYFGEVPKEVKRIIVSISVTLKLSCAVDLDGKAEPVCQVTADAVDPRQADLRLARENGSIYLVAVNGATLCNPEAATTDCSGVTFGSQRIEVAGMGPGVDFCVKTKHGSVSHVFFTGDIENETSRVPLWYVTRKGR